MKITHTLVRKAGVVALGVGMLGSAFAPLTALADASLTIDSINGQAPGGHCIAGPLTIIVHGTRGTNGGPYSVEAGNGVSTSSPVSVGSGANGAFTNVTINYTPSGTGSGLYLLLFHGSDTGNDSHSVFVNQCIPLPTQGVVTVIKSVSGGTAVPSDFTLHIGGNNFPGSSSGTDELLTAGSYAVTEDSNASYNPSFSGDCDASGNIAVVAGNNYTCTVTNTFNPVATHTITATHDANSTISPSGSVSVTDGGTQAFTFSASVGFLLHLFVDGLANSSTSPYTFTNVTGDHTISVTASSTAPTTGTLTVIKHVINDNLGTTTASGFSLHVKSGATDVSGSPAAGSETGTQYTLTAGSYTVSEDAVSGYTQTGISGDCNSSGVVTVPAGGNVTCTITNDDNVPPAAYVSIVKSVDNATPNEGDTITYTIAVGNAGPDAATGVSVTDVLPSGLTFVSDLPNGSLVANTWSIGTIAAGATTTLQIAAQVNTGTGASQITNIATLTASDNTNTNNTGSVSVTVNCPAGQHAVRGVCVVNPPTTGTFHVVKVIKQSNTLTPNDFSFILDNGSSTQWTASGTNDVVVTAGTHSVVEDTSNLPVNDHVTYDNCTDVNIQAGDSATCTVTNIIEGGGPGTTVTGSSGGSTGGGGGGGQVLGEATSTPQVLGETCGLYMNQHLRQGSKKNNSDQVTKLQQFLNKWMNSNLPTTGFFGPLTTAAVKAFQLKYSDVILKPWGITAPTGLAYLTTLYEVNALECPALTQQLPPLVEWSKNPNAQ